MNNRNWMLLSGAALGAGAMYFLDSRGHRRGDGRPPGPTDARKLHKRVMNEVTKVVTYPDEIDIFVSADLRVCLTGRVLMDEADRVITGVQQVRGVREVDDRLERHSDETFRIRAADSEHAN